MVPVQLCETSCKSS